MQTLRFYERKGLLPPPPRSEAGYRLYGPESVRRIRFIKHGQDVGFTLAEIRDLLALRVAEGTTCLDIQQQALSKLAVLDQRLAELTAMKQALQALVQGCSTERSLSDCPILDTLDPRR